MDQTTLTATINLGQDFVEAIAERVAALIGKSPTSEESTWLSLEAAAHYLDWPKKRLYNLVAANQIPHRKQGNRLLFNRAELDRWLDLHYQGPEEFTP